MRKFLISTVVVLGASLAFVSPATAGIVDSAPPLKIKIATFDGKKKIKVARKLKAVLSCSVDCNAKVTFAVKTPAGTIKDSTAGSLTGSRITPLKLTLNGVALRFLKRNHRRSRFTVRVTATDRETGKRVFKKRTFKFFR